MKIDQHTTLRRIVDYARERIFLHAVRMWAACLCSGLYAREGNLARDRLVASRELARLAVHVVLERVDCSRIQPGTSMYTSNPAEGKFVLRSRELSCSPALHPSFTAENAVLVKYECSLLSSLLRSVKRNAAAERCQNQDVTGWVWKSPHTKSNWIAASNHGDAFARRWKKGSVCSTNSGVWTRGVTQRSHSVS